MVTATLVAMLTAACGPGSSSPRDTPPDSGVVATKSAPNPVRHDLEPLTKRYTALGTPASASWVSGTMGDPRVPGPSRYWLDSVITLTPATVHDLKARYQPVRSTAQPEVWPTLTGELPSGGYLTSDALDAAFSNEIRSRVLLAEQAPVVVITSVGE